MNAEEKTKNMENETEKEHQNPVLKYVKDKEFPAAVAVATDSGAIRKSFWLMALSALSGSINIFYDISAEAVLCIIAAAFFTGLRICLCPDDAKLLAPVYAVLEGLSLGFVSVECGKTYPGIVLHTMVVTLGIAILTSSIFSRGWIRVSHTFKSVTFIATAGIALLYLTDIALITGFDIQVPLLHETGWKSIAASIFIICVASMNLLLDYEEIYALSKKNYPEDYEWYFAFALVVTLFWIYIEAMNLLRRWLR